MNKRTKKLLAMMAAPPRLRRVSGLLPLSYTAKKAGFLTDYRIYGQTVDGESVGDRTGNLFDETIYNKNVANVTPIYVPIYVGNVNYVTCSTTCPKTIIGGSDDRYSRYIFILSGNVNTGAQNDSNGVSDGEPRTIQPSNGYVTICYRKNEGNNVRPWEYETMLNVGSSALLYEPYGYKVPVTVEGKNLLQNTATSQTINGVTFTVNEDGSVTCNGTATAITTFAINIGEIPNGIYIVSGCPNNGAYNTYRIDIRTSGNTTLEYNSEYVVDTGNGHLFDSTDAHSAVIRINTGYTCDNLTFYPMIRLASIEDGTYEPYQTPITTNLYFPEQIKKIGDEAEYIDYGEQKFHRISGADLDVTLPALPTVTGTNVLSVGTEVQPSLVEVTGRIRPVPTGGGE